MFKINIKFGLCVLLFIAFISSAEPQSQFMLRIGGNNEEFGNSLIQSADGGYAVAGFTASFGAGQWDMYIVKLSSGGTLQWSRTVGGTNNEEAFSMIQTTDGGYAVAGYTGISYYSASDMLIVKLDASGSLQWARTVGGAGADVAYSIIQTPDGGYVVAGSSDSFGAGSDDMYFVKLDASGMLQWSKTVGGTSRDMAFSIKQATDGGFVAAGFTASSGAGLNDVCIVKLNSSGSLQWSRTVGGSNNDAAHSIIQTADGGYAAAGFTGTGSDMYIVKLDSESALQWTKTLNAGNDEYGYDIIQSADGGYIVAGLTEIWAQGDDFACIMKLSANGSLQWSKIMGGGDGVVASIVQTNNGGFAVAGNNWNFGISNDMCVIKFDVAGGTCGGFSSPSISSATGGTLGTPTLTVNSPNSTLTSPSPSTSTGGIVTTLCLVGVQPVSNEIPVLFELYQNYPNPFNPKTVIRYSLIVNGSVTLRIYDVLGHEIETLVNERLKPGTYEVEFDGSKLASGIYFYKLSVGNEFSEVKRMVLVK